MATTSNTKAMGELSSAENPDAGLLQDFLAHVIDVSPPEMKVSLFLDF